MNSRKYFISLIFTAFLFCLTAAPFCMAQQPICTPYNASGIYRIGEKVGWTVTLPQGTAATGNYSYTIKKNNMAVLKTGNLDFSKGSDTIETTLNEPAM